jgi:hypothetical protein
MMGFAAGIRRRTLLTGTAIALGGGLAGAVTVASLSASAASTAATLTSASSPSATASSTPSAQHNGARAELPGHPGAFRLDLTGTITSVSTSSVTIKTSSGAIKTYKVDASSDIDKNGEAQLSSLAVGDAVRYSLVSGTSTIDKLHAGSEAKDAPSRPSAGMSGRPGAFAKDAQGRPAAPNGAAPGGTMSGSGYGA